MWFHLKSNEPFAFAGLWDVWRRPDGSNLESFTIITTEPNKLMHPIHDRMPVILRGEDLTLLERSLIKPGRFWSLTRHSKWTRMMFQPW
jgi:SOS response associated peptidase (SRAP)